MPSKKSSKRASKSTPKKEKAEKVQAEEVKSRTEEDTQEYKKEDWGGRIVWALFLVFLGTILLLNTTGIVGWNVWGVLWRFWPIFIILAAVRIILGKSPFAALISGLLAFIVFLLVFLVSLVAVNRDFFEKYNLSIPDWWKDLGEKVAVTAGEERTSEYIISGDEYEGIDSRVLDLDLGAGSMTIKDEDTSDFLYLEALYYENFGEPDLDRNTDNSELEIKFKQNEEFGVVVPTKGPSYDFVVGKSDLKTNLKVNIGAGSGKVDFDELVLSKIESDVGAGNLEFYLGEKSIPSDGMIFNIGAGSAILEVPKEVGYKVSYNVGVGQVKIGEKEFSGLGEESDVESDNYDEAKVKFDIEVDVGVGSFELIYK